ncbi:hypothetical protein D9758_007168 [Tetrapyrgos nigripes]|uniref:Uncharacterized protein n=1 Tax=Tetrapyrgos nigripes TaxID=182062 RepID=A0A8H5D2M9_9AGAR|nr:hypothetical protein D9758_007168 [Tetrapyrgos nigripes]
MASSEDKARPPQLSLPKEHDYAPRPDVSPGPSTRDQTPTEDTDSDTATNTSDEFDWDEEEEVKEGQKELGAKRGRALYMAFMRLARHVSHF